MAAICVIAVLLLLSLLKLGLSIKCEGSGLFIWLKMGFVRLQLMPGRSLHRDDKNKAVKQAHKKNCPDKTAADDVNPQKRICDLLIYIRELMPTFLEFANRFRKKLRIDRLRINLIAGGNPADAVCLFGEANALFGSIWHPLNEAFVIRDGKVQTSVDFEAENTRFLTEIDLSMRLWQILILGLWLGIRGLFKFLRAQRRQQTEVEYRVRKAA